MKLIAINGSPRKSWNTATLLKKTIEGAQAAGAETELIHLYDLTFKGCTSCFVCKMIDSPAKGRCAMKDDHPCFKTDRGSGRCSGAGNSGIFRFHVRRAEIMHGTPSLCPSCVFPAATLSLPAQTADSDDLHNERFRGNERADRLPSNDERHRSLFKEDLWRGRNLVLL